MVESPLTDTWKNDVPSPVYATIRTAVAHLVPSTRHASRDPSKRLSAPRYHAGRLFSAARSSHLPKIADLPTASPYAAFRFRSLPSALISRSSMSRATIASRSDDDSLWKDLRRSALVTPPDSQIFTKARRSRSSRSAVSAESAVLPKSNAENTSMRRRA